ncbi:MAG: PadR family transcriptional regulator [Thaumarchaeota archaeon]|nr:PadR family transcriptional regulator [Nitrososphaerota archaeon]MCL5317717.1 PadR family transcriptional regulator [Nitrososphaerota archaeon]
MEHKAKPSGKHGKWLEPQSGPRGLLKYYTLKRLSENEATGYDLLKEIEEKTGGAWRPGAGSIYPILDQLKELGYIRMVGEIPSRGQKIYGITDKGVKKVSDVKSMFEKAASKWQALRPLMLDIADPKALGEMMVQSTKMHFQVWKQIMDTEKMSKAEKASFLRELQLNLQREILWIDKKIESLETSNDTKQNGGESI